MLTDGVGMGRRNWPAPESPKDWESEGCKDGGKTSGVSCVDTDDVGESVVFCDTDIDEVEGAVPSP